MNQCPISWNVQVERSHNFFLTQEAYNKYSKPETYEEKIRNRYALFPPRESNIGSNPLSKRSKKKQSQGQPQEQVIKWDKEAVNKCIPKGLSLSDSDEEGSLKTGECNIEESSNSGQVFTVATRKGHKNKKQNLKASVNVVIENGPPKNSAVNKNNDQNSLIKEESEETWSNQKADILRSGCSKVSKGESNKHTAVPADKDQENVVDFDASDVGDLETFGVTTVKTTIGKQSSKPLKKIGIKINDKNSEDTFGSASIEDLENFGVINDASKSSEHCFKRPVRATKQSKLQKIEKDKEHFDEVTFDDVGIEDLEQFGVAQTLSKKNTDKKSKKMKNKSKLFVDDASSAQRTVNEDRENESCENDKEHTKNTAKEECLGKEPSVKKTLSEQFPWSTGSGKTSQEKSSEATAESSHTTLVEEHTKGTRQWERKAERVDLRKYQQRKSILTSREQSRYLYLHTTYVVHKPHKIKEKEEKEMLEFKVLHDKVSEEQKEFQQYLEKLAQTMRSEYNFMSPEADHYYKDRQAAKKKRVQSYPKYFNPCDKLNLSTLGPPCQLLFVRSLLEMGTVPKLVVPNMDIGERPKIPVDYKSISKHCPCPAAKPTEAWNHEPCSQDKNCDILSRQNKVHITISSSAIRCLVNNHAPHYNRDWEIPFTVKDYELEEGGKKFLHRAVYIDNPLPGKEPTGRDKNTEFYKYALRANMARLNQTGHTFTLQHRTGSDQHPKDSFLPNQHPKDSLLPYQHPKDSLLPRQQQFPGGSIHFLSPLKSPASKSTNEDLNYESKTKINAMEKDALFQSGESSKDCLETVPSHSTNNEQHKLGLNQISDSCQSDDTLEKTCDSKKSAENNTCKSGINVEAENGTCKSGINAEAENITCKSHINIEASETFKGLAHVIDDKTFSETDDLKLVTSEAVNITDNGSKCSSAETSSVSVSLTSDVKEISETKEEALESEIKMECENKKEQSKVQTHSQLYDLQVSSASDDESDVLVIDEPDVAMETPASPTEASSNLDMTPGSPDAMDTPASPVSESSSKTVTCIEAVSEIASPEKDSGLTPLSPDRFSSPDVRACKIIPLQRESEEENVIDNSKITVSNEALRPSCEIGLRRKRKTRVGSASTLIIGQCQKFITQENEKCDGPSGCKAVKFSNNGNNVPFMDTNITAPLSDLRSMSGNTGKRNNQECSDISGKIADHSPSTCDSLELNIQNERGSSEGKSMSELQKGGDDKLSIIIDQPNDSGDSSDEVISPRSKVMRHKLSDHGNTSMHSPRKRAQVIESDSDCDNETNRVGMKRSQNLIKEEQGVDEPEDGRKKLRKDSENENITNEMACTRRRGRSSIQAKRKSCDEIIKSTENENTALLSGETSNDIAMQTVSRETRRQTRRSVDDQNKDLLPDKQAILERVKMGLRNKTQLSDVQTPESQKTDEQAKKKRGRPPKKAIPSDQNLTQTHQLGKPEVPVKKTKSVTMATEKGQQKTGFTLENIMQAQTKLLDNPKHHRDLGQQQYFSQFKFPEKHNITYHLWSLGAYNVMIRSGYHGVYKDQTQKMSFLHVAPKMEYQVAHGVEQVTQEEISQDWASVYVRPNCRVIRVRVDPLMSNIVSVKEEDLNKMAPAAHGFNPASGIQMLANVFHRLHQCNPGQYLLHHTPGSSECQIKKATENNKRGSYDLHMTHIGYMPVERHSVHIPWVPIDTSFIQQRFHKKGRIPATFEPRDYKGGKKKKKKGKH